MDFKTYKIEQYKDGSWVDAERSSEYPKEFTGLTEDQTQNVIDAFVSVGTDINSLRVTEET